VSYQHNSRPLHLVGKYWQLAAVIQIAVRKADAFGTTV
jgi:hypothetical protein